MTNDLNPAGVEERDLYYYDELLAPCPLCGSKAFMDGRWFACCSDVNCQCSVMPQSSAEMAIAVWNRRASLPQPKGETAELVPTAWQVRFKGDVRWVLNYYRPSDGEIEARPLYSADAITSLSQRLAVANDMIAGLGKVCDNLVTRAEVAEARLAVVEAERDEARLQQKAWADKWDHTVSAAEAQLAQARAAAIEECAKVVLGFYDDVPDALDYMVETVKTIAAAIRAMKGGGE